MHQILFCILLASLAAFSWAHGLVRWPPQRGIYTRCIFSPPCKTIEPGLPVDFYGHFPAGARPGNSPNGEEPGAGRQSQIDAAGTWVPYEPQKNPAMRFRAGVCGDLADGRDFPRGAHLRGGRFYYPPNLVNRLPTYRQGGIVNLEIQIAAHHNGYIELTVCDVRKFPCNGEISEKCLRSSRCRKLRRAPSNCDGQRFDCAPIDPNYPNRWYLPCFEGHGQIYNNIKYKLPNDLNCQHCVLQWYYVSANSCNPPGVINYFRGPEGPRWWGECSGQGGAIGGYRGFGDKCGGTIFPEEYYQCSDIRITPFNAGIEPNYSLNSMKNPIASLKVSVRPRSTNRGFRPIAFLRNNKQLRYFFRGRELEVQLEAVLRTPAKSVHIWVEGEPDIVSFSRPPYTFPQRGFWDGTHSEMRLGEYFSVQITAKTVDGFNHYLETRLLFID